MYVGCVELHNICLYIIYKATINCGSRIISLHCRRYKYQTAFTFNEIFVFFSLLSSHGTTDTSSSSILMMMSC